MVIQFNLILLLQFRIFAGHTQKAKTKREKEKNGLISCPAVKVLSNSNYLVYPLTTYAIAFVFTHIFYASIVSNSLELIRIRKSTGI